VVIALLPGRLLSRCGLAAPAHWHINVMLSHGLLLALVLATPCLAWSGSVPHFCLCQSLVGLPCPGCGITRSLAAASRVDLASSLAIHPGGIAILVGLLLQFGLHAAMLTRPANKGSARFCSRVLERFTWLLLCAVWLGRVSQSLIFN
jgi:hypothetical protein